MKARLTRLSSTHSNLRTTEMEGEILAPPKLGENFLIYNDQPITPGASHRLITTTEVKNVERKDSTYYFSTNNSKYKLEILGD